MVTIQNTKRYQELEYRHLKLVQLYSVLTELRAHTNQAVDGKTSDFYHKTLYDWSDFGPFLVASMDSMKQVFYIELDGFIGSWWTADEVRPVLRKNEEGSLGAYLYNNKRVARKKSAVKVFETLLKNEEDTLKLIHNTRGHLAHFKELDKRNASYTPSDIKTREVLDRLAEVLYLLGYQRWNQPHYIEKNSASTEAVQSVIDKLVAGDKMAKDMRKRYLQARDKWYG